jgi:anti-sigma regulatory factor (Ser/Thr protein kinase)
MPYYLCDACGLTSYSAARYSSPMACPTCRAALTDDEKIAIVPGSVHDVSCTLPARPAAAAQARRAFAFLALPEITREDLALLVSELVTNAVRHAGLSSGDPIDVKLVNGGRTVRLAVHDGGGGFTFSPARDDGPPAAGGRGLAIVDALSANWGVDRDGAGCTVWCELAVDAA